MNSRLPALIFDFGGVLLDWDPRNLFRKFFGEDVAEMEQFLVDIDFYGWNLEQDKGRPFADGVAELSARFPQYADLIRAYDERWEESIRGPIQSTVNTLQPFQEKGYSLFGLTNWSHEKFQLVSHQYSFFSLFENILVSGFVELVKPDPRIFEMMLARIDRPADECVFIDDSAANIAAARQLGFMTIRYESTRQMLRDLARME
ncbi:MAG: HAD family phosphatase [Chloroflexi bacterium]|nr:HAD family phosphatase [Chloroflexota bacterium]